MSVQDIDPNKAGAAIVYGPELDSLTESKWKSLLQKQELVFARISP